MVLNVGQNGIFDNERGEAAIRPRVLFFSSNPYVFESSVLPSLHLMADYFDLSIILLDYHLTGHLKELLTGLAESGKIRLLHFLPTLNLSGGRKKNKEIYAMTLMVGEVSFWIKHLRRLRNESFSHVVLYTEFFLSDFIAASLAPNWANVFVVHSSMEFLAASRSKMDLFRQRFQVIRKLASEWRVNRFWRLGLISIQSMAYRLVVPFAYFILTGRLLKLKQIAKWYVIGGNFGAYMLASSSLRARIGESFPGTRIYDMNFCPEDDGALVAETGDPLFLMSGDLGESPELFLESIVEDILRLGGLFGFEKLEIRPHPRFIDVGLVLITKLENHGFSAALVHKRRSLHEDARRSSLVIGAWSSALQESARHSVAPVVGLVTASKLLNPQLVLSEYEQVVWFDSTAKNHSRFLAVFSAGKRNLISQRAKLPTLSERLLSLVFDKQ